LPNVAISVSLCTQIAPSCAEKKPLNVYNVWHNNQDCFFLADDGSVLGLQAKSNGVGQLCHPTKACIVESLASISLV
jgi:hypothetical protein